MMKRFSLPMFLIVIAVVLLPLCAKNEFDRCTRDSQCHSGMKCATIGWFFGRIKECRYPCARKNCPRNRCCDAGGTDTCLLGQC